MWIWRSMFSLVVLVTTVVAVAETDSQSEPATTTTTEQSNTSDEKPTDETREASFFKTCSAAGVPVRKIEVIYRSETDTESPVCRVKYTKGEDVNDQLYYSTVPGNETYCLEKARELADAQAGWGFTCE